MNENQGKVIDSFITKQTENQRSSVFYFTNNIISNILKGDLQKSKELLKSSRCIRDEIEFDKEIVRNESFYFGYLFAIEKFLSKWIIHQDEKDYFDELMKNDPMVYSVLDCLQKYKKLTHKDFAQKLGVSTQALSNTLKRKELVRKNLIMRQIYGRNTYYSLSARGNKYFESITCSSKKNYSKEDLKYILEIRNFCDDKTLSSKIQEFFHGDKEFSSEIKKLLYENKTLDGVKKRNIYILSKKDEFKPVNYITNDVCTDIIDIIAIDSVTDKDVLFEATR